VQTCALPISLNIEHYGILARWVLEQIARIATVLFRDSVEAVLDRGDLVRQDVIDHRCVLGDVRAPESSLALRSGGRRLRAFPFRIGAARSALFRTAPLPS